MSGLNDGAFDLPFERQEVTWLEDDFLLSGGVVVMAAAVPDEHGTHHPGLVFRFALADGSGFAPPIALVVTPGQLDLLVDNVTAASEAAVEAAERGNRGEDIGGGP